jgi:hypothetical protein
MESTQHRLREYDEALATTMSSLASRERGSVLRRIGHTGPQRHVRARAVVVRSPISQDGTQMPFTGAAGRLEQLINYHAPRASGSNPVATRPAALRELLVAKAGIEPATHGFSVRCSTN